MSEFLPTIPRCHNCGEFHPPEKWVRIRLSREYLFCDQDCVRHYKEYLDEKTGVLHEAMHGTRGPGLFET